MGFFKDFKDDLSQAVNELLPDDDLDQEVNDTEEIVNTLDTEEIVMDDEADSEKMKEWLNDFTKEEETEEINLEQQTEQTDLADNMNDSKEEEVENMDDNIDLELLEALNADEDAENETESKEKAAPKSRAASVASDDEVTVIAKGTTINGSISSDGSLDIMGNITGDVECLGKLSITGKIIGNSSAAEVYINTERMEGSITSEGSVKVGLGTVIIGDVIATSGVIAGAVKGEIDINGPIVIDSTAIIKGNIKAKSVQINNGAVIEGFCSLSYSAVDVDNIFE
ncbi:MAG: polymer-forming cytoskeletal protein [Herbinix sp.]|nr:polymer-forming cytoskeletal protein [Herbinix sp.]